MSNYTAADVKKLRDLTGAGMMDCKKALEEADGDFDKAVEILRVKGAKDVGKRAGRTAANGLVAHSGNGAARAQLRDRLRRQERRLRRAGPAAGRARRGDQAGRRRRAARPPRCPTAVRSPTRSRSSPPRSARSWSSTGSPCSTAPVAVYLHRKAQDLPPQVGVLVAVHRQDRRGRRRRRPRHRACRSPRCGRSTSPATRCRPRSSSPSGASPRRPPARRASPRRRCPKIVEGRVNAFFKDFVLLEQASVAGQQEDGQAGAGRGRHRRSPGSSGSRSARPEPPTGRRAAPVRQRDVDEEAAGVRRQAPRPPRHIGSAAAGSR